MNEKSTFDFGDLEGDSSAATAAPEIQAIDVNSIVQQVVKLVDAKIKNMQSPTISKKDVQSMANKQIDAYLKQKMVEFKKSLDGKVDGFMSQVTNYKHDLVETWVEIFPTLVKMWGTTRGIGKKIGILDQLIRQK